MKIKILSQPPDQTIKFELDSLPGEMFRIVIPEIISDTREPIIPWEHPVRCWHVGRDSASWHCEIPDVIRMDASVVFGPDIIEASVAVVNQSDRTWELLNAFTCFAFYEAPLFDCPDLNRILLPVGREWKSVGEILSRHPCPGHGPCTFFPIANGPVLDRLWLCRTINQSHSQVLPHGAACVVSKDARWVAGISAANAGYVFINRHERCIHANPMYHTIHPGQSAKGSNLIRIMRGGATDFANTIGDNAA